LVRPDELIDVEFSDYDFLAKPPVSMFGGGQPARVSVAHLMVDLRDLE